MMENIINILNIVFAIVFVLYLPGNVITYIFFPRNKIDLVERIALSFAFSIAIVPLVVFYMNLLGIPINKMSVSLQIFLIITLGLLTLITKYVLGKESKKHDKK